MINIFMICSKQFTDLNLRLFAHSVKNCCKTTETNFTLEDMEKYGTSVFSKQHQIAERRKILVEEDYLPSACRYCIDAEPNSMRSVWNVWDEPTSNDEREVILESDWIQYVEIVNSTACDLACIYCNAENSTTWAKEMGVPIVRSDVVWKQKLLETFYLYLEKKDYSLIPSMTFAFSGGEPTYDNETFALIKNIVDRCAGKTKIVIQITSNFNAKEKQLNKFVDLMSEYQDVTWIWVASIDDIYERNDAIRFHSKFDIIEKNIKTIYAVPNVKIVMMPSISVFSMPFLDEYVNYCK
jgi:sulfatase maturation enzyme AslB (radical SAM superfamily)